MEVKLIQTQLIELARIENNDGQIEGVKRNPRTISEADMEKLKKSLQDHPDMTALRELVVYPHGDKFVVLGGNMRLRAMRMLGYKDAPCKVIPIETPTEQLNAFIVIDNGDFGAWDWDALANEWDDLPLGDWGVPNWGNDDEEEEPTDLDAEPRNKPFVLKVTFPTADKMNQFVAAYKDVLENDYGCTISETGGEL